MGKLRIVSDSEEPFRDRLEAAGLLAAELKKYSGKSTIVLGIPRGGVVIASEIARMLSADLDIVLSRKLGAPGNPELAIGAVTESGKIFFNEMISSEELSVSEYVKAEKDKQIAEIKRRIARYRAVYPKVPLCGRDVIITDDGLATGATMRSALWAARQEKPGKLIAAIPVSPPETARRLTSDADEVICLRAPLFFGAVGQFYKKFDQVEDEEVLSILKTRGGA